MTGIQLKYYNIGFMVLDRYLIYFITLILQVEKLLDDPDMRTLLMDPEVMKLLSLLNTKPEEAHR